MSPHIFFTFVVVLTAEGWGRRPRRIFAAGPSLLDPLRPPRLSAPHSAHGVGPAHPSSYRGKGGIFGLPRGVTGEGQQSRGGGCHHKRPRPCPTLSGPTQGPGRSASGRCRCSASMWTGTTAPTWTPRAPCTSGRPRPGEGWDSLAVKGNPPHYYYFFFSNQNANVSFPHSLSQTSDPNILKF